MSKIKTIILTVLTLSAGFMLSACKIEPLEDDEPIVLSGYVKDSDDHYLQYIVVELIKDSSLSSERYITLTDINGHFEFDNLPSGADWFIRVTDTGGANESISYTYNQYTNNIMGLKRNMSFDGSDKAVITLSKKS